MYIKKPIAKLLVLKTQAKWRLPLDKPFEMGEETIHQKLLGRSSRFPRHALSQYRASLGVIAPKLLYERQNIGGSQLRVADARGYGGKSILVVTGGCDTDHPREIDGEVVAWLRSLGTNPEYCFLPDRGIEGNGHMLMLEDNSDDIADLIVGWMDQNVGKGRRVWNTSLA